MRGQAGFFDIDGRAKGSDEVIHQNYRIARATTKIGMANLVYNIERLKERLNEVASFVRGGLQDLSISRTPPSSTV